MGVAWLLQGMEDTGDYRMQEELRCVVLEKYAAPAAAKSRTRLEKI